MLYDYPYKYRIKFNPFSGRKRQCVIDNPSYTTIYLKELIQILMRIKLRPGNKHALCYKKVSIGLFSRLSDRFFQMLHLEKKNHIK